MSGPGKAWASINIKYKNLLILNDLLHISMLTKPVTTKHEQFRFN